jgi:hypothetical protein
MVSLVTGLRDFDEGEANADCIERVPLPVLEVDDVVVLIVPILLRSIIF